MTHIKRSRRLQAGLAGLSVVSALGAAVGLGLTTHTGSTAQASQTGSGSGSATTGSHAGGEGDDDSTRSTTTSQPTLEPVEPGHAAEQLRPAGDHERLLT